MASASDDGSPRHDASRRDTPATGDAGGAHGAAARVAADFTITGRGFRLGFRASVPAGPVRAPELLPVVHELADAVVGEARRALGEAGRPVSCASGCSACCHNLVAVSPAEARRIAALVDALPEPGRRAVGERFARAQTQLDQGRLLQRLQAADEWSAAEYAAQSDAYFALRVACPFLDGDLCAIYDERPIACREYLVTSAPALCRNQSSAGVERVALPMHLFNAVARWQAPDDGAFLERWVPLVVAPQWAARHADESPARPGLELLRELLSRATA